MSAYSSGVPLSCIYDCDDNNGYCDHLCYSFPFLMMPHIEPATPPPHTSHFDTAANVDPDQSINEIILANCNTIAPSALHGNAWGGPTSEDVWTLFGTFIIDVPPSPSSMFSSESLDQDNTANSVPSPREDHPTAPSPPPEIPYQEVPSGTPPLHLFYTPDRDIHAAKVDLINFARAPWAEQIPSELLLAFLERVPLPKATRGKGARKGAKGYYCHWPGCNKTDMTLRLDHAKAHVARHIDSKPHKCSDCERAFLRRADLKRHNGTCHVRG